MFYQHAEFSHMNGNHSHDKHPLAGVILAGGKSTRMGINKAFITVYGQRIIDRTVELFSTLFRQVILVTNAPLEYAFMDLEIAADLMRESSPLMGIYTGLFYSSFPHCFVVGCDMPLLNRSVLEYLISLYPGHDLIIPVLDDGYHPLHAIYSKRSMKSMAELMQAGQYKITDLFSRVRLREVTAHELRPLDAPLHSFFNVNTPQDLDRLTGML
jgi:molybdopterin-guanine dinucleotide biosynthesis protein A